MQESQIMSDEEIHEFGINIVIDDIRKSGFTILSVTTDRAANPQIIARSNEQLYYILVRTACYPNKGKIENVRLGIQLIRESQRIHAHCCFASIGIANSDGTTDLERGIAVRGAGYYVAYNGIEKLGFDNLSANSANFESATFNKNGEIAGSVIKNADGRHTITANDNADTSAMLMSICLIFANDLDNSQRISFSKWVGLPIGNWTQTHQQLCAQALLHYFMEAKVSGGNLPPSVLRALQSFSPQVLPQLKYPLTDEIRTLFSSLFGC